MNKKGFTMSGWFEGILLSFLFVIIFAGVIGTMNSMYNEDYQIGLVPDVNQFSTFQDSLDTGINTGEASTTSGVELALSSSWGILKSGVVILWTFFSGNWVDTIITDYMRLPTAVALIFKLLWYMSIGFIILYIIFKVKS